MPNTPRFEIPELINNAGNVVRINYLLRVLDALLGGGRVVSDSIVAQPGSPAEGDLYLLPLTGTLTGAEWSTFALGSLALYTNGAWGEIVVDDALEGVHLYVASTDRRIVYRGSVLRWQESGYSTAPNVTATGNGQGLGYDVTRRVTEVLTASAGVSDSLDLPPALAGDHRVIRNQSGATLDIYPASGEQINALGANVALTLATGTTVQLWAIPTGRWYTS